MAREIRYSSKFKSGLKYAAKKDHGLEESVTAFFARMASARSAEGDRQPGLGGRPIYKCRLALAGGGKRGGARVLYYFDDALVCPLLIYRKGDQENTSIAEILDAFAAVEASAAPSVVDSPSPGATVENPEQIQLPMGDKAAN